VVAHFGGKVRVLKKVRCTVMRVSRKIDLPGRDIGLFVAESEQDAVSG
jgi:hypothetical protein